MKKALVFSLFFVTVGLSCKKSDNCNLTEETLVGSYMLTALTYKASPSAPEENLYAALSSCKKDNLFVFRADKTFTLEDAGVVCNPPFSEASTWSLIGTSLEFAGTANNVIAFDCNNMVIASSVGNSPGDVLTATYIRQ